MCRKYWLSIKHNENIANYKQSQFQVKSKEFPINKYKDSISIQVIKIKPQPNFLKNSNGEQYKIGMTEEVFKKGPEGMEDQKITRRVVVDENYHGDVYIRFEKLNRETTYTKNNKLISKDVWILETQNAKLVKN